MPSERGRGRSGRADWTSTLQRVLRGAVFGLWDVVLAALVLAFLAVPLGAPAGAYWWLSRR